MKQIVGRQPSARDVAQARPPRRRAAIRYGDADDRNSAHESGLLWLEVTGRCQLMCVHCYAASGPDGDQGDMTVADWCAVIEQAPI
jgi:uncharacterized radical SAM superfamily Fe-S cluster-containing enzyme